MTLAVLAATIAVAAAVQTVSGFGFALVAAPVLVAVTDPVTSVAVIALLGALSSAAVLAGGRERPQVLRPQTLALLAWALPGTVLGVLVVSRAPEDPIRLAIGVLVLLVLVERYRHRDREGVRPLDEPAELRHEARAARHEGVRPPYVVAGVVAGAMTTTTGINGPPLVLVLTGAGATPRQVRDTLAVCFVVLDVVGIAALAIAGELRLPPETWALPIAALAGVALGHRVFERLPDRRRSQAVTVLLVAAAATAIASALA